MEKSDGTIWSKSLNSKSWRVRSQHICKSYDSWNLSWSSWFHRSSFFVSPTRKWCETRVGRDKHCVMRGMQRIGTICVVFHVKWQRLRCGWRRKSQQIEKERDLLVKCCCGKNSRNWTEEIRRNICWHWSSRSKWRLILVVLRLHPMEERSNTTMMNAGKESEHLLNERWREETNFDVWARMNAHKDRIAETGRVKEKQRAGETDASGEDENQHEVNKMRKWDTSTQVKEERRQPVRNNRTTWGGQHDSSKRPRTHQHLLLLHLCPESLESGDSQVRLEPVLLRWSGHVDDDIQSSALDVLSEIDGRESRYIKEVLEWYRDEDTGDLKKSQVNELLESMTSLDVKICEINENDVMDDKINQNTVTDAIRLVFDGNPEKTVRVYEEDMKLFLNEISCFLLGRSGNLFALIQAELSRGKSEHVTSGDKEGRSTLEVSFLLLRHKLKRSCREALLGTDTSIEYLGIDSRVSSRKLRNMEMNRRAMWKSRVDVVRKHHLLQRQYLRKVRRKSSMCT